MKIHIIGGGIIGLCSAWYLQKEGYDVTVIDKSDLKNGTSHGNAGMIVPSHFVPLAAPGVIAQGIKWMFDSKSPFYVKPRLSLELAQWMWRFYRSCTREHVNRSAPILFQFNEWSKHLYKEFSQNPGFQFCFEEVGLMMLYKTAHHEADEKALAEQATELGIIAEICDPSRLKELEPDIDIDARGGIYFPGDAHLYPNLFIAALQQQIIAQGGSIITGQEVVDFRTSQNRVESIKLDNGEILPIDKLLISSGSWSPQLLKKMGAKILLQDGKGYSITLKDAPLRPRIPTILSEAKVAVTPMGEDLRIGGTLELSNLSTKINVNRLKGIIESMPRYYPQIHLDLPQLETVWHGYRPCTPDGMPYIDQFSNYQNAYVATGHGMMGMSLGPATGKMVAEIVSGNKLTVANELFILNRF